MSSMLRLSLLFLACFVMGHVAAAPLNSQEILVTEDTAPSDSQIPASAYPVDLLGTVAAVQLPIGAGRTFMFYQNVQGDIVHHSIEGGAFTTGRTGGVNVIVRANATRRGTPIAASSTQVQGHSQIHVYYVTPRYTLAELRIMWNSGLYGGAGKPCPLCIDHANFVMAQGSQVLYGIQDKDNGNILRVGFESAGTFGTITEAVTTNFGRTWQIAPVPDKK